MLHSLGRLAWQINSTESQVEKTKEQQESDGCASVAVPDLNAAGVEIGATEIYIAVPGDRDAQPVRRFSTFTEDLHAAAVWLKSCNIESVAMESTGVY